MDKHTQTLFDETAKALEAMARLMEAQQRLEEVMAASIERCERRLDAQGTIIRALSGDERVLYEQG